MAAGADIKIIICDLLHPHSAAATAAVVGGGGNLLFARALIEKLPSNDCAPFIIAPYSAQSVSG